MNFETPIYYLPLSLFLPFLLMLMKWFFFSEMHFVVSHTENFLDEFIYLYSGCQFPKFSFLIFSVMWNYQSHDIFNFNFIEFILYRRKLHETRKPPFSVSLIACALYKSVTSKRNGNFCEDKKECWNFFCVLLRNF